MDKKKPPASKNARNGPNTEPVPGVTYPIVRLVLGFVLGAAGAFKIYQLGFETQDDSPGTLLLAVFAEAELLGGLGLMAGGDRAWTHPWIIAIFAGFAGSSLFRGMGGKCSCECFGSFTINPWVTLVFDLTALAALLMSRPPTASEATFSDNPVQWLGPVLLAIGIGVMGGRQVDLVAVAGAAMLDGQLVKDGTLTFTGESGKVVVQTDGHGGFRLPFIRPGRYAIALSGVTRLPTSSQAPNEKKTAKRSRRPSAPSAGTESRPILSWIEIEPCSNYNIFINL